MENYERNPSLDQLALGRIGVGESLKLHTSMVPNLHALRVTVANYATKQGIKLSVHKNEKEDEIEIVRKPAVSRDEPVGEVSKARPRKYW